MYYGGDTTVTCYNGRYNQTTTCPKDSNGNFLTIDETSKSLIDNHIWNTGAIENNTRTDTSRPIVQKEEQKERCVQVEQLVMMQ